jgi:hypothetical protein
MKKADLFSIFHVADARRLHDLTRQDDPAYGLTLLTIVRTVLEDFVANRDNERNE